jgi:hypothetical protein
MTKSELPNQEIDDETLIENIPQLKQFALSVHELVLEGRVGTCTYSTTQSLWPVFLSLQPRAVSLADATTVRPIPGTTWFHRPIARSDTYVAADCESTYKPWQCPVVRADSLGRYGASDPEGESA